MKPKQSSIIGSKSTSSPRNNEVEGRLTLEAGKFCLDIAKLIFGGVILAGLMKQEVDYTYLFVWGLMAVTILMFLGFLFLINSKKY